MGNKKKLINKGLINLFPKDINTFVELFTGSGIVSMNTVAKKYMINDIDNNLFRLYSLFKDNSSEYIINHIEQRINEYNLARERTKRNEFNMPCGNDCFSETNKGYIKMVVIFLVKKM